MINDFISLFNVGMIRGINDIQRVDPAPGEEDGTYLNLGAGKKNFDWATSLDLPDWNGEKDRIPWPDESVDGVIAFHFLEHLTTAGIKNVFREVNRVLKDGGTFTIVVPHRLGALAFEDPDHKTFFNENSWKHLLYNRKYETGVHTDLELVFNFIAGDSERTLALFTQFMKVAR